VEKAGNSSYLFFFHAIANRAPFDANGDAQNSKLTRAVFEEKKPAKSAIIFNLHLYTIYKSSSPK